MVLHRSAHKIRKREQCESRARRGLQKIKEETKNVGFGPVGSGSHGSRAQGSEMVNSRVGFLYAQGVEVPIAQHKMNTRAPFRRSTPAATRASSSVATYRCSATEWVLPELAAGARDL